MADNETGDPRIVSRAERNAATSFRDHAGGDPDEAVNFTTRANDLGSVTNEPALANSTLGSRAKARQQAERKAVQEDDASAENKAQSRSRTATKRARKR